MSYDFVAFKECWLCGYLLPKYMEMKYCARRTCRVKQL